jgi:hypothetical protein
MPGNKELADRTALAVCLAVFLAIGFGDIVKDDFPVGAWPWIAAFVYGLIVGAPLLVLVSRTVANLGAARLMVGGGVAILFAHHALDLLYGVDYGLSWFGMYSRLHIGMFADSFSLTWLDDRIREWVELWAQDLGWVRLLTYGGLGYIVARRKVLLPGIVAFISVALADHTLGWLGYLPASPDLEAPELLVLLLYDLTGLLNVIAIQTGISACVGLVGAAIARSGWPSPSRRPVMPLARRRIRPARRIAPHNR